MGHGVDRGLDHGLDHDQRNHAENKLKQAKLGVLALNSCRKSQDAATSCLDQNSSATHADRSDLRGELAF